MSPERVSPAKRVMVYVLGGAVFLVGALAAFAVLVFVIVLVFTHVIE